MEEPMISSENKIVVNETAVNETAINETGVYETIMKWIKNAIAGCATGAAAACAAGVPMPATTPEEVIALAHRTYDYVARSVPEKELAALKDELAIDEKWYASAKKANDGREMRNAARELRSVRRRILFRHPDLQFKGTELIRAEQIAEEAM